MDRYALLVDGKRNYLVWVPIVREFIVGKWLWRMELGIVMVICKVYLLLTSPYIGVRPFLPIFIDTAMDFILVIGYVCLVCKYLMERKRKEGKNLDWNGLLDETIDDASKMVQRGVDTTIGTLDRIIKTSDEVNNNGNVNMVNNNVNNNNVNNNIVNNANNGNINVGNGK